MTEGRQVPILLQNLAAIDPQERGLFTAYAMLRSVRAGRTHQDKRYVDLQVADQSASVGGKIWEEFVAVQEAALALNIGRPVKLLFEVGTYQGAVQLAIRGIRLLGEEDDESYNPEAVYGEGIRLVEHLLCETLVFDIETVPAQDKRELPSTVAESLVKFAEYKEMETGAVMGMSPFFGKIVSLAFGEGESAPDEQRITALVVPPPDQPVPVFPDWIRPIDEAELLRAFWALAASAETVVTYNGRRFDIPFLTGRSLMHGIPARVDLASNRWSLRPHLDLFEILGQQGRGPSNLDVVCWALGIESPKGTMDGSMVAPAYQSGEIVEIAEYNRHDVRATTAVYQRVRELLLRYRRDWTG